ncbi:MAG: hypothetical protein E7593_05315 [Ruminococcaceae bacterium]|nr:hypothetical protein [Oscillospiraceae bacterium]
MKKTLSLLLAVIMLFTTICMASCSKKTPEEPVDTSEQQETNDNGGNTTDTEAVTGDAANLPDSTFDKPVASDKQAAAMVTVSSIASQYKVSDKNGVTFNPLTCPYFEITGFPYLEQNKSLYRLLLSDKSKYPSGVASHADRTAGGRIRFRTDSDSMTITVKLGTTPTMSHMTVLGIAGIDIYKGTGSDKTWVKAIYPKDGLTRYTQTIQLSGQATDYTLVLPLFAGVESITIAVDKDAQIGTPTPYKYEKPVVFYGSSIVNGCSASRPGTSYPEVVTRMLDANLVNLGFNGAAKGEQVIAQYIAGLEMSAFVLDYDYNADNAQDLLSTHYDFYKTVRNAHPDIPIIIMTKNNVAISDNDDNALRRRAIKNTYNKAIEEGDKNVYYIDGRYVFPEIARDLCTVDGTHPSDLGMYYMAQALYPVLKAALEK